jgi:hypothetical protein
VSGRVKPGDEQRLMIQAGSTEVTSVLRQRKYHNLPLFYLCAVLVLYPMTDSRRHTRERSLSGDFDVFSFRFWLVVRGSPSPFHFGFCSPISSHPRNIITMMPLRVSLGERKTPSEPPSLLTSTCLTLPSSQAARRDQNRIAQREFRLRKQQRVMPPSSLASCQRID